jgi:hypothetical protein
MKKTFKLSAEEIAPIATDFGGCMASDRITVDGCRVGYMYRESPVDPRDSGWRFLAGDEDDRYMADLSRHDVYDVNTIANYDPDILPFLRAPAGSAFERDPQGRLVAVV